MKFRTTKAALLGTLVAGLFLAPMSPASAIASSDEAEIRQFWTSYSVSDDTQDRLLNSIESGNPTEATRGISEPTETREVRTKSSVDTVSTYSDGSISVTTLETGTPVKRSTGGTITPMATVSGCTARTGSGYATYSNCLVRTASDAVTIYFRANYERYSGGGSKITWHGSPGVETRGVGASFPTNIRWVPNSTRTGGEAVVTYQTYVSTPLYSEVIQLSLRVNWSGTASVTRF